MGDLRDISITSALDYADGSADRNGATLDMKGFDGVYMIVKLAAVAAGATTKVKAQQGADSGLSDAADLAGTGISIAADDDNQIFVIHLHKPEQRYVRLVMDKDAANNCAESAVYVRYAGDVLPVTLAVTDAVTVEHHYTPAEGTA